MMKKQTKIYVIPGLGETTRSKNYREVIKSAKKLGFVVMPIKIVWDLDKGMDDFIQQANVQIPDNIIEDYVFGFSFGAYIASILAKKKKAKGYIFCSLSPYFKDDLKNIPEESKKYFGKTMINSFKKYTFPQKAKGLAYFLIGEKDWNIAIKRARTSYNQWGGEKKFYVIKGAGHELSHSNYTKKLSYIMKRLRSSS